ncbi:hypothetical protein BH11MYX2_BH11MYX2_22360 [soil metagenome]
MVLVDFLVAEALSVITRRVSERGAWGLEHDLIIARFLEAEAAGEIRRLAQQGYSHFDRVLSVVRDTSGRLNAHDAMLVVLQRDGVIGAVATFDEALAATPGFLRTD